jgi:uncharacterized protein DUF6600/FecR-like protein
MKTLGRWGTAVLALLVILNAAALADDPPGRVARLQYLSGEVSLQPSGVNDWVPGVINRPLTTADRLWTDKNSRAELHLGAAAMRVNSETSLTVTNLTDGTAQVELDQGTLNLRVRRLYHGEIYEIDTPNLAFTVMKAGEYRFDVDPNGDTTVVTVWHGEGEATGQGRAVRVKQGHTARFTGGTSLANQIYHAPEFDGFDDWCRVRDRRQDYSQSARYVSPEVIGAEDLDDYGTWRVVPAYGAMWVPAVAPGWAPYHYGHWAWVEPWGWTWIDDAPWGFAPCHYGRWVYYSGYWGWVPGPVAVRPVYAPALVAWVGGGNWGVGLTVGGGPAVGWFPLGYGEPYLPPYGASRNYFRNVNVSNTRITNITNVTNNYYNTTNINSNNVNSNNTTTITKNNTTIVNNNTTTITKNTTNVTDNSININGNHNNVHINYANQKVPGAVTAVPSTVLANSQPVDKAAVHVPASELKETSFVAAPPVTPSRNSVLGAKAGAAAAAPPVERESRKVVEKLPAPPKPVPFAAKEQELANHPGRPVDAKVENELRTRIQKQPANMQDEHEAKQPASSKAPEMPAMGKPAVRPAEVSQPVPNTPGHVVPRPPVKNEIEKAPAATAVDKAAPHENRPVAGGEAPQVQNRNVPRPPDKTQVGVGAAPAEKAVAQPEQKPVGSPETPRSQLRVVPRPPEKLQVEKPSPDASSRNPGSQSGEGRPAVKTETPQVQDHAVPRPPDTRPVEKPAGSAQTIAPHQNSTPAANTDTPRAQDHAVPRPPEHGTQSQPSYEPVVSSPHAQPRLIPAPPNSGNGTSNTGTQSHSPRDPFQARPSDPQPSTPRVEQRPDRAPSNAAPPSRSSDGGSHPNVAPRTEQPAREAAPSSGNGSRSAPSAPAPSKQQSESAPGKDKSH